MLLVHELVTHYEGQRRLDPLQLGEVHEQRRSQCVQLLQVCVLGVLAGFVVDGKGQLILHHHNVANASPPHILGKEVARLVTPAHQANPQPQLTVLFSGDLLDGVHHFLHEAKLRWDRCADLQVVLGGFM